MRVQPLANSSDSAVVAKARAERRRFRRVRVDLPGRLFVPLESREAPCKIVDLSLGGASVEAEFVPEIGTHIVLYVDGFGRFEGDIARRDGDGFGERFVCTPRKLERTAEKLTLFMNKALVSDAELRRHDRTPTKQVAHFTRNDGSTIRCEVLDLSTSGISIKTDARPQLGEFVLIGQLAGRVARHHADGIGIEFVGVRAEIPSVDRLQSATPLSH